MLYHHTPTLFLQEAQTQRKKLSVNYAYTKSYGSDIFVSNKTITTKSSVIGYNSITKVLIKQILQKKTSSGLGQVPELQAVRLTVTELHSVRSTLHFLPVNTD